MKYTLEIGLFIAAAVCSFLGYKTYYRKIQKTSIHPNRWSWLIWSAATLFETVTYSNVSDDWYKSIIFYFSSIACIVVTIKIWRHSVWQNPTWTETFTIAACVAAPVIWYLYASAWWAHVILLVALPIAFIPTWMDAWKDYKTENTSAWLLWASGDVLVILFIWMRIEEEKEWPYAVMEFVCHGITTGIVAYKKISFKRP